jgi:hypothetical protein
MASEEEFDSYSEFREYMETGFGRHIKSDVLSEDRDKQFHKLRYRKAKEWLIADLLPCNSVAVLAGSTGTHKTFLANYFAYCLALGIPVLKSDPSNKWFVKYLALEDANQLVPRIEGLNKLYPKHFEHALDYSLEYNATPIKLTDDNFEDKYKIEKYAELNDLIVIDTLSYCLPDGDENKGDVIREALHWISHCAMKGKCTFLLLHHTTKNSKETLRGSSEIENIASTVLITDGKKIKVKKQRSGKTGQTFHYQMNEIPSADDEMTLMPEFINPRKKLNDKQIAILAFLEGLPNKSATKSEILEWYRNANPDIKQDTSRQHIKREMDKCVTDGLVTLKRRNNEEEYEVKYE